MIRTGRSHCRKPEHELGRTARYNLRRAREERDRRLGQQEEMRQEPDERNVNQLQDIEMQPEVHGNHYNQELELDEPWPLGDEVNQNESDGEDAQCDGDPHDQERVEEIHNLVEDNEDEENDEEDEEVDEEFDERARPLYAGAQLSMAETMMIILNLMLRHNLSLACIKDIFYALQLICPNAQFQKISLYKFKKYFKLDAKETFRKHFYCLVCHNSLRDQNTDCDICGERLPKSHFIELPFTRHLQEMIKRKSFWNLLQHRFNRQNLSENTVQDIYDAELYRAQDHAGFSLQNPNCLSFLWYTDGVQVFKSSKTSMWPIYLTINELPYKERIKHENILLAGLWFGKAKPNANLFLMKLRAQIESLYRGQNFVLPNRDKVKLKFVLLAGVGDVPAKTHFLSLKLFSGAFGCTNCKLQGHTLWHRGGLSHSHIFPYQHQIHERTSEETVEQGNRVVNEDIEDGIMGVLGVTVLSKIMPDFIRGMGIDVMHKVYGGCMKKLLYLWFDKSYSGQPYSLRLVIDSINKRLISIKPPKFVHRMPRSVEELCNWKCSELKMYFYYYGLPVMTGIMQPLYLNHFTLLVYAISLLNSNAISQTEIRRADRYLHKFVKEFPILYGERQSTINVHGLLHLPSCVSRLGPLWVYSCFPYEDLNGKLLNHIHGTSHLDYQVAVRHSQRIKLHRILETLDDGPIKDFVIHYKKKKSTITQKIHDGCYSIGRYQTLLEMPEYLGPLLEGLNIQGTVQTYCRLLKNNKLYISESYTRTLKTNSAYVMYNSQGKVNFGCVLLFCKITHCECENDCDCEGDHYALLDKVQTGNMYEADLSNVSYPLWHLKACYRRRDKVLIPVSDLRDVCVYIHAHDVQPILGLPINDFENE